jgi:hypothetical protein
MDDITKKIEGEKEELTELESKMSEKQTKKEKFSSLVRKFNRRTVVIMTSVALIGGAIYLNWLFFSGEKDTTASNDGYTIDYTDKGGEASFASSDKSGNEYFASVELSRTQARDEAVQVLAQVVENEGALEEVRADAAEGIGRIAELIECEANIESLITAKGFEKCVAVLNETSANVVVQTDGLLPNQVLQIKEIVCEQSGLEPAAVKIIEMAG